MSNISKNTESKYRLNGITSNAPIDWSDVTIEAEYENDSVQPNLTISEFNFNLESRKAINEWIANGTTSGVGIFEGMPFELDIFNNNGVAKTFKAFIDFTESYNDLTDDGEVLVSIMKDGDIENFFDKLNGTTCGYLEEIGVFTSADYINVPYVVEKKFNLFEILLTSIVLYLMVKELAESIRNTSESIATASGIFSAGFTGLGRYESSDSAKTRNAVSASSMATSSEDDPEYEFAAMVVIITDIGLTSGSSTNIVSRCLLSN